METPRFEERFVSESLEFVRTCVSQTPLRRHADLFSLERANANQALKDCVSEGLARFRSDLARWQLAIESPEELFERLVLAPNLQATFFYRMSRALHLGNVELIPDVVATLSRLLTGMEIYYSADIGPGLKIIHGLGSVIGAKCKIGSHFTMYQSVTIGDKLGKQTGKRPTIGDYVIASAGVQVLGPVTIGAETIIGANSVVLRSLPGRCIAAGVPAQVKVADLSEEKFLEFLDSIKG